MKEIKYPANRSFWTTGTGQDGSMEPNQVTTSWTDLTFSEDASEVFPELPETGELKKGDIYSYNGGMVIIEQDHERTIYPPQQTPALITFYRKETGELEWIENEQVEVGDKRWYEGIEYEAITAHLTLIGWIPPNTPALWTESVEDIPVWKRPTGAHDAYNIGDQVYFPTAKDLIYESLINSNTWSPTEYTAGWVVK